MLISNTNKSPEICLHHKSLHALPIPRQQDKQIDEHCRGRSLVHDGISGNNIMVKILC